MLVTEVLQKMVKQRRESIEMYEQGRPRRAGRGRGGGGRGDRGLPAPRRWTMPSWPPRSTRSSPKPAPRRVKDMGRVMALLKERHAGELDMGKASAAVKARLSA